MSDVVYVSQVRIEKQRGPIRLAHLPGGQEPIRYGVHGGIAEHYGVDPSKFPEHTATIDHVVGAAGG